LIIINVKKQCESYLFIYFAGFFNEKKNSEEVYSFVIEIF